MFYNKYIQWLWTSVKDNSHFWKIVWTFFTKAKFHALLTHKKNNEAFKIGCGNYPIWGSQFKTQIYKRVGADNYWVFDLSEQPTSHTRLSSLFPAIIR